MLKLAEKHIHRVMNKECKVTHCISHIHTLKHVCPAHMFILCKVYSLQ